MKESKKLFILRGLPASGKSSWAKKYVNEHPETSIILSKDGIREMLGVYWVEEREPLVSRIFHRMLHDIVSHGTFAYISSDKNAEIKSIDNNFDIIIDNTNLNIDDVNEIMNDAYLHDYKIQEVIFNMPVEKCIEGDSKRKRSVGRKVIENFYHTYISDDLETMKDIVPLTENPILIDYLKQSEYINW